MGDGRVARDRETSGVVGRNGRKLGDFVCMQWLVGILRVALVFVKSIILTNVVVVERREWRGPRR